MASFARETAYALGTRQVFAGMILHGGYGGSGPLADLWVYDFGADDTRECPWVYIGDTSQAIQGGAAGWDPTSERFVVAGGIAASGTIEVASSAVWTWAPSNSAMFTSAGTLPGQDVRLAKLGADNCDEGTFSHRNQTVDENEECHSASNTDDVDACREGWEAESGLEHRFGCTDDPACTDGLPYALLEASPAGRWQAASWMDPLTGELRLAGGTTGCRGAGCGTEVEDLYDVDPTASATLTAVNLPGGVVVEVGVSSVEEAADYGWGSAWVGAETDGTELTTVGLRGACAAAIGWTWDRSFQAFDGGASSEALAFGGTLQHDLPQATQHHGGEVCLANWSVCTDHCIEYDSTWEAGAPLFADAAAGLVPAAEAWMDADDGMAVESASSRPIVFDCAMAPIGSASGSVGEVVVVGGRPDDGSSGTDDVWTSTGLDFAMPSGFGNRYGASVVFDVVSQRNYVFGGATSGSGAGSVFRVSTPASAAPDEGVVATLAEAEVRVTQTAAGSWERETTLTVGVACEVEACWARTLEIVVPTGVPAELDTLAVTVALPGGVAQAVDMDRATVRGEPTEAGEMLSFVRFPLPVLVTAATTLEVGVAWGDEGRASPTLELGLTGFGASHYPAPAGSLGSTHHVGRPLAAWLPDTDGAAGSNVEINISSFTVLPLPGFMPITQGVRSEPMAGVFEFSGVASSPRHLFLYLLGGGQALPLTTSALGHPVYAFTDAPYSSAVGGAAFTYITNQLPDDLAWFETSLGPIEAPLTLVVRAPTALAGKSRRGISFPGVSTVNAGLAPVAVLEPGELRSTALHELAHHWFGGRRPVSGRATWLIEGLCNLVAYERIPPPGLGLYEPEGGPDYVTRGMRFLIREAATPGNATDLEWAAANMDAADTKPKRSRAISLAYNASTYALAQLHAVHLAHGGSATSFWAAMATLFDDAPTPVDGAAVQTTLDQLDGPSDWFYDEWVADGRMGIPLLGFDQFVRAPSFPEPASPTGESNGPASLRIAQVQGPLFGWSDFTEAPYALLCRADYDEYAVPFTNCSGSLVIPGASNRVLTGTSTTLALVEDASVTGGYGGLPAYFYLVANHTLWPGSLTDDEDNLHEQVLCAQGSNHALCHDPDPAHPDQDGDGWGGASDCDIGNPAIYPGAPETSPHMGSDDNCDGWQCLTRGPKCDPLAAL